ncbi:unnamed protein product [Notodromas monacha]|uniref:ABC transmembrane type-1 domain-containing protein n=1 Tax=Notodromas monacha TaxID=399045 RepID=A0A7R9GAW6_9CRUS|nr:unnamed protein product [Notodromas monacha]CAG0914466.1 unnamed protein product [Notodromas monacha]
MTVQSGGPQSPARYLEEWDTAMDTKPVPGIFTVSGVLSRTQIGSSDEVLSRMAPKGKFLEMVFRKVPLVFLRGKCVGKFTVNQTEVPDQARAKTDRDEPISRKSRAPFDRVGFLSRLFVTWVHPLFWKGWRKTLDAEDLYRVPSADESARLAAKLTRSWDQEQNILDSTKRPSLLRALVREFGLVYMLTGVLACIEEVFLRILQPVFMGLLIRYYSRTLGDYPWIPDPENPQWSWIFGSGIMLCSVIYCFTHHALFFSLQRTGMRLRIACSSIVFQKALRLSQRSLAKTSAGQMVNLLSNDVNRFDQSLIMLHYLWVGPLQLCVATAVLYYELGFACFAGIAALIVFIPLQGGNGEHGRQNRPSGQERTKNTRWAQMFVSEKMENNTRCSCVYCAVAMENFQDPGLANPKQRDADIRGPTRRAVKRYKIPSQGDQVTANQGAKQRPQKTRARTQDHVIPEC